MPISDRSIEQLKVGYFDNPDRIDKHITVVPVQSGVDAAALRASFGNLDRLSAEEVEIALIRRIAEIIMAGAGDDELLFAAQ